MRLFRLFSRTSPSDPKAQLTEWRKKLRKAETALDRQINGIIRAEAKIKSSIKEAAKKGDQDLCRIYGKELVGSRRAVGKIYVAKAHLNTIRLNMQEQLAILKTRGSLQKSSQVFQAASALIKIPAVAQTMRELSKEMIKAGMMEEVVNDTVESHEDQEELEEAADVEVDNMLWEVTAGQVGQAPILIKDGLLTPYPSREYVDSEDEDEELKKMQRGLEALMN
ncbi:unnamed protein product [Orchesella dallaii]|uniref:Charged multivesicular body protein 3 n=1 Tax=Orchesella dallaii TaxID=48710 RepID=A0ABP1QJS8_9HEXA